MSLAKVSFLAAWLPLSLALAQSSGIIGGTVTDTQGSPIAAAQVRYQSIPPSIAAGLRATLGPGDTVVNGTVQTDSNGKFTVSGLPAAQHLLCASVPSAPYLDSCVWGQAARVSVSASATASQNIVLQKGVYLNVRVNDPKGLLPQTVDGIWTPRKLVVGVAYGSGAFQGASNTAVDSAGRNYQLIIPAGQPFALWLYSTDVALANASGTALASSAAGIPFQATAGQDQAFTFTVTGPATQAQPTAQ